MTSDNLPFMPLNGVARRTGAPERPCAVLVLLDELVSSRNAVPSFSVGANPMATSLPIRTTSTPAATTALGAMTCGVPTTAHAFTFGVLTDGVRSGADGVGMTEAVGDDSRELVSFPHERIEPITRPTNPIPMPSPTTATAGKNQR